MARSVGLFIRSSDPLEELARRVAAATGASAAPGHDPGVWELRFGTVTASLSAHAAADSEDAFLCRYPYALAAVMAEGSTAGDSAEVKALREVARVLHESTDLPALLVVDVQNRAGLPPRPASHEVSAPPSPGD
ncbi:MAG: hypothetical protein M3063_02215 [Actinomycetota bacterium]|nr:hypothetical protein [Actinomycetota bacterium]